jgi:hypothetical protein
MKLCVVLVAVPVNVVPGRAGFLGLPEPDIGELLAVVSAGVHQDSQLVNDLTHHPARHPRFPRGDDTDRRGEGRRSPTSSLDSRGASPQGIEEQGLGVPLGQEDHPRPWTPPPDRSQQRRPLVTGKLRIEQQDARPEPRGRDGAEPVRRLRQHPDSSGRLEQPATGHTCGSLSIGDDDGDGCHVGPSYVPRLYRRVN